MDPYQIFMGHPHVNATDAWMGGRAILPKAVILAVTLAVRRPSPPPPPPPPLDVAAIYTQMPTLS